MSNDFIKLAHRGKNQWWRYLLGSLLALFTFQIIGGIATVVLLSSYVQLDGDAIEADFSLLFITSLLLLAFAFTIFRVLKRPKLTT